MGLSDLGGIWSIEEVIKLAKERGVERTYRVGKLPPTPPIPVHMVEPEEYLGFPIIAIEFPDGLHIAVGIRKLTEARKRGDDTVLVTVLTSEDMKEIM